MAEIGEPVAPPDIDVDQDQCPFDHEEEEPPNVENDLIGVGGTLARRMKNAEGTHKYEKIKGDFKVTPIKNPNDDPKHPFYKKAKVVKIAAGDDEGTVYEYPVSCAAHHCIPAQEALKSSLLLAFMVKKGDSEPLKGGSYSKGVVWSDVGYDVNGSQNGVFLPGSYAVGGGQGGMGVWASTEDGDEDKPENPANSVPDAGSNKLTGKLYEIAADNRKWQYVKQAVRLCPGQFHDRHLDYSLFVRDILQKIFENYRALYMSSIFRTECSKCKERKSKLANRGIPTPYGLVARLNGVSERLKGFLNGSTWRINIYTSRWGKAYMEAVKKGNPAAH